MPRATADLFGARPVDLCLVDGIETNRGGEGPWIQGVEPIKPSLLFAGRKRRLHRRHLRRGDGLQSSS